MSELLSEIEKWEELRAIHSRNEKDIVYPFDAYVLFLKQPLKVGDFVPANEEGNVLSEPQFLDSFIVGELSSDTTAFKQCQEYQAAEARVKFEGFAADIDSDDEMFIRGYGLRLFIDDRGVCYEHSLGIIKSISDLCGLGLKLKG